MAIETIDKSKKELESQAKEIATKDVPNSGAPDMFEVRGKASDKAYRWINTKKENLEMKRYKGWTPVSDKSTIKTFGNTDTSQHVLGDLVLCEMPREKYEKIQENKRKMGAARRKEVSEKFREEAKRLGLKPYGRGEDE